MNLASLTTLRVGGPIGSLVEAGTEAELVDAVRAADADGTPLLVLGGGSNLLVGDRGFDGVVVRDTRADVSLANHGSCGGLEITATAGTPWDALVAQAVGSQWSGFEALSGIPGSTGATPIQNVGAYGAEVADIIALIRTWDREDGALRSLPLVKAQFGYRDSMLKRTMTDGPWGPTPRYVVLDVTFHTRMASLSAPVRYQQLATALGVELGARVPIVDVRAAVLELRSSKGMVLDPADHDTWSAGSFFTNPIVPAGSLPEGAPAYPVAGEGMVKTSAAWLIERAGFSRGFAAAPDAAASLSTKHTLALTNRGGASAADIVALARAVRDGVRERFGITLVPEPVTVGVEI
ncbi:UDP-N-acetylmuramate dehydrogenase [Demequina sp. SYSU T00039]|uniref:UDP-N-acetylenolpyruvoylglucosamine reductase n=1 Tax=Demequina lignilytica TaxID=3051663 RepID=A0AAW7M979_9MICO|nr:MULTISPECIES: UDP-N-acetylmuramate dehydrogenase [unclassified Demequina]MDN4478075.1 UDP-N-acetylmuramate dehydrogenase [Demequina sp. SYSU T00039-1]MDN4488475.1 UDP-N-acetylmuramate dehydrogenase [Demequina sp. SYSU T00039]